MEGKGREGQSCHGYYMTFFLEQTPPSYLLNAMIFFFAISSIFRVFVRSLFFLAILSRTDWQKEQERRFGHGGWTD